MNNELITRTVNQIKEAKPEPQRTGNEYASSLINDLFKSLQAAKPGWRASFKTDEEFRLLKKTWVKAFIENGINTPEQLALGMKRVRADESDFVPSVGKFIKWCKPDPADVGLPDEDSAYREATNKCLSPSSKTWSHPAVFHAGREYGWYFLSRDTQKQSEDKFKKIYAKICDRVMKGEEFVLPKSNSKALEHHDNGEYVKTEQNKKAASDAIEEMRRTLGD